ncbi:MAG: bifunctional adenosylcobinamide kinase/adenosylcobinamide-phosphate guanylyltransferase [Gammaproteobacteria bacterium]|nr:bifunctional adenosylcobinamide kinase/adenosylcobinamide-phosphate guanylyltransferase [Gammaproteobacteria bacterium]
MKHLILGGIKSGKSRIAEQHAQTSGLNVIYIATATAEDDEMRARILAHQQQRNPDWALIEEPLKLAESIEQYATENTCLLIECLTLWLTNLLCLENEKRFKQERQSFMDAVKHTPGTIIFVSNETSMGIVPLGNLSRRFCDEAGLLHQQLAQLCNRVDLIVAGLPHTLKGKNNEL